MEEKRPADEGATLKDDQLIVITGAGGFIGGNLALYFKSKGRRNIRAVDKKQIDEWYLPVRGAQNICADLSKEDSCHRVCEGASEVYNLAADMGGMGFIERFRVECLRSVLINTNMIEAAYRAGVQRYFFSSSACIYNTLLQSDLGGYALKETDVFPAMAERGYGWEKLISEMFCEEYWHERRMKTFIARFHNVYGPYGAWEGGREKAPAAICRKVIEAVDKQELNINIWGNGEQTRSFMYVDDCVKGIDLIAHCDDLIATPVNLGSSEVVSINNLVSRIEGLAGVKLRRDYDHTAPRGVAGRSSDNTFVKKVLSWEPDTTLEKGLSATYEWIKAQYEARKRGKACAMRESSAFALEERR